MYEEENFNPDDLPMDGLRNAYYKINDYLNVVFEINQAIQELDEPIIEGYKVGFYHNSTKVGFKIGQGMYIVHTGELSYKEAFDKFSVTGSVKDRIISLLADDEFFKKIRLSEFLSDE